MTTDDFVLHPQLRHALHDLFGLEDADLRADADLEQDLQLDSLSIVELQVVLEESMDLRVTEPAGGEVRKLGDLQALLDRALVEPQSLSAPARASEAP